MRVTVIGGGADALVIATEWAEFAEIDLVRVRGQMRGDAIFDGRCLIDPKQCASVGLRYGGLCAPAHNQDIHTANEPLKVPLEI